MDDEETVALIAGGHVFGKSHGVVSPDEVGPPPEIAPIEAMGLGWQNPEGTGFAQYTMTNGIECSWTPNPTQWDNSYLGNLFAFEWEQIRSPAGAIQWTPTDHEAPKTLDAHIDGKMNDLMMTSDIALKVDPAYRGVCEKFLGDFDAFTRAFSKDWYKLTHCDMGPKERYLGPKVMIENDLLWQEPIPEWDHEIIDDVDIAKLKDTILSAHLSVSDLAFTAFSSAATYRDSDKRGGANGARLALAPQNGWAVNRRCGPVVEKLRGIAQRFQNDNGDKKVSLADLIVLGGCAAVEKAAADAGVVVKVPFTPGRADTTRALTDEESFEWLKPVADGFRNYTDDLFEEVTQGRVSPEELFLDKANLLLLSAPEWVALAGGLRVLGANYDSSRYGVFTDHVGVLMNDFFTAVTSMDFEWKKADEQGMTFTIDDRQRGDARYMATRCDVIFGSNQQLRAISEIYASAGGHERVVSDFVKVWHARPFRRGKSPRRTARLETGSARRLLVD